MTMTMPGPGPNPGPPTSQHLGFTIAATTTASTLTVDITLHGDLTFFDVEAFVHDWIDEHRVRAALREPSRRLAQATHDLSAALAGVSSAGLSLNRKRVDLMTVADDLATLTTEMTDATSVMEGATAYITTVPDLIAAAVAMAVANGATAAQLKPVTDLGTTLAAKAAALTAALEANVPPA